MASKRQTLLEAVQEALSEIDGTGDYVNVLQQGAVQLKTHETSGDERTVQTLAAVPAVFISVPREAGSLPVVDETLVAITFHCLWYFGAEANEEEVSDALADMLQALETAFLADGFGVQATGWEYESFTEDPETGQPYDGVNLQVTTSYRRPLGER